MECSLSRYVQPFYGTETELRAKLWIDKKEKTVFVASQKKKKVFGRKEINWSVIIQEGFSLKRYLFTIALYDEYILCFVMSQEMICNLH